jgi:hypothetical protein
LRSTALALPLLGVVALWLWVALWPSPDRAQESLLATLVLGLIALVAALTRAYPRTPFCPSLALIVGFVCYGVWVAVSAAWATSPGRVWTEAARTAGYLLAFSLASACFTTRMSRRAFRYLLLAAPLVFVLFTMVRLWASADLSGFFAENRLAYPTGSPNYSAALVLVTFWPLMWLASSPEERAPLRGLALGVAVASLGMAFLTQSRGALWGLAISTVLMFLVSPARLRLLLYLLVPGLFGLYEFPRMNRYWVEGPVAVGGGAAAHTLLLALLTASFLGLVLALLERWIGVSRRMKTVFGVTVLVACLGGIVYGSWVLAEREGGLDEWATAAWQRFTAPTTSESPPPGETTRREIRLLDFSSGGRVTLWRAAGKEFQDSPVWGVGGGNFPFDYYQERNEVVAKPADPYSLVMQLLAESGLIGAVLLLGGGVFATATILRPRLVAGWAGLRSWRRMKPAALVEAEKLTGEPRRAVTSNRRGSRWGDDPTAYGWSMALLVGAFFWFIHANLEPLWKAPEVTIPLMLLLGAALAESAVRGEAVAAGATSGRAEVIEGEPPAPPEEETFFILPRRAERHQGRRNKTPSAKTAEAATGDVLPDAPRQLSTAFRVFLATLGALALIAAALPYTSLCFQHAAQRASSSDAEQAVTYAAVARWLYPTDSAPLQLRASIYTDAARAAALSDAGDRAGAVLDNLALALDAATRAVSREPADWEKHFRAAWVALDLFLAREQIAYGGTGLAGSELLDFEDGRHDWSALAGVDREVPIPGRAAGSLARNTASLAVAAAIRSLTQAELRAMALKSALAAEERNPLEARVTMLREFLQGTAP